MWGGRWLEQAAQDAALRAACSSGAIPASRCVAILSLTLGIGANTALFEVVNAVRLQSLPVADPSSAR